MKKILISVTIAIFSLTIPYIAKAELVISEEPHDYKKGLLDDTELIKSNNLSLEIFDNDIITKFRYQEEQIQTIEFNYPVNITAMYQNLRNTYSSSFKFTFIGGETEEIKFKTNTSLVQFEPYDFTNVTKIEISKGSDSYVDIFEIDFFGTYEKEVKVYDKAHTLTATTTHNSINLNWINPNLLGFENVLLYVNGELKETLSLETTSYNLTNLNPNTSYQIELIALYDDGGMSEKEILAITTDKILPEHKEIQKLRAKATHEKVDLSWNLPIVQDEFKHVNIYRGQVKEEVARKTFLTNVANANDTELTKIFETNGTYFNDLTVEESTQYEYKLTVTDTEGTETSGIKTRVKTASAPLPTIDGLIITKPDDENYLISWDNTEGEIIIKVGDEEIRVPAEDKEILIPIDKVPLDDFNNPQIEVIIVTPDGKESKPIPPNIVGEGFKNFR